MIRSNRKTIAAEIRQNKLIILWLVIILMSFPFSSQATSKTITSSYDTARFYVDYEGNVFYFGLVRNNTTYVLHIDPDTMTTDVVFQHGGCNVDISIKSNALCFRHVYIQMPFVSHIGPNQYFTCPISNTSIFDWDAVSGIQTYKDTVSFEYKYVNEKLYKLVRPQSADKNGAKNGAIVSVTDGKVQTLRTYDDCFFTTYETAICIHDGGPVYHLFDATCERDRDIFIQWTTKDDFEYKYDYPGIIISGDYLFVAKNNKVLVYNIDNMEVKEIAAFKGKYKPDLFLENSILSIYAGHDHMIYQYDIEQQTIISTIQVPQSIPPYLDALVLGDMLMVDPARDAIYVYRFGDADISKINLPAL